MTKHYLKGSDNNIQCSNTRKRDSCSMRLHIKKIASTQTYYGNKNIQNAITQNYQYVLEISVFVLPYCKNLNIDL